MKSTILPIILTTLVSLASCAPAPQAETVESTTTTTETITEMDGDSTVTFEPIESSSEVPVVVIDEETGEVTLAPAPGTADPVEPNVATSAAKYPVCESWILWQLCIESAVPAYCGPNGKMVYPGDLRSKCSPACYCM